MFLISYIKIFAILYLKNNNNTQVSTISDHMMTKTEMPAIKLMHTTIQKYESCWSKVVP